MYTYQTVVRYEDLDAQGRVKIPAVLNYLQNAAVIHAADVGYDIDRMAELDLCWVVLCWDVRLGRRIRWNETLTVQTWPYSFYGSIGKRGFRILSAGGETLAEADSWWALLRQSDQTMVEVPAEMAEAFQVGGEASFPLRRPRGKGRQTEEAFPVSRFDIDTNGHVNNSRFAEMACSFVPDLSRVGEVMVEYKHSAHLGDHIAPSFVCSEEGAFVSLASPEGLLYVKMQVSYKEEGGL